MPNTKTPRNSKRLKEFEKIARATLGIETLERRNRDSLDFHDVSVGALVDLMEAAYALGVNHGARQKTLSRTKDA
jgi:hypothetical protein